MPPIDGSPERSSTTFRTGNERLYEAYNDLHTLAQDFEKPFDAPAILVVGHQTDGKSGGAHLKPFCRAGPLLRSTVLRLSYMCCSPRGGADGVSVQPCWRGNKNPTAHHPAHEIQPSLRATNVLSHHR